MNFSATIAFVVILGIFCKASGDETTVQTNGNGHQGHHHEHVSPPSVAAIYEASQNGTMPEHEHRGPRPETPPGGFTAPSAAALEGAAGNGTMPEHEHRGPRPETPPGGFTMPSAAALEGASGNGTMPEHEQRGFRPEAQPNEVVENAVANLTSSMPGHGQNRDRPERPEGSEHRGPPGGEHEHHPEGEHGDHSENEHEHEEHNEEDEQEEGSTDDEESSEGDEETAAALVQTLKSIHRQRRCFRTSTTVVAG